MEKKLGLKSPKMNFIVNLFFFTFMRPIHPFWIPHADSFEAEWWGGLGGVIMGKNKFALKCISGKIKCFETMFFFFFSNGKPGRRGPTQPA